jgi:hypothetical protein
MSFRQCPRRLWLETHRPELAPPLDPATQALFDTGHAVGAVAHRLYDRGAGALVEYDAGLAAAMKTTDRLLRDPKVTPIFEATFEREGLLVRADVLERQGHSARVVEVKASTSVHEEHVDDCAIQAWVLEASRARPRAIALAHVDNRFVYPGDGDYTGLLVEEDLTTDASAMASDVPRWLHAARRALAGDEPPVTHGSRCSKPYDCPFVGHCWPHAEFPLTDLPGIGRKLDDFVARGYADVRDVPEELISGADQSRFWRAVRTGKPIIDRVALRAELAGLPYPRYHLDFETISFAVPIWPGTRPYQQLPFQWSLHVEPSAHEVAAHFACLDLSGNAPMRDVASSLVDAVGPVGPVFMYTGFERQCLATLASFCTDLAEPLGRIADRLVDLHPIVKRHYCHPGLHGSWSIKAVIPTIAPDMDYSRLDEIQDGGAAQRAYLEASDPSTPAPRRAEIRERLLRYCAHDTLAMLRLARWCAGSAGEH